MSGIIIFLRVFLQRVVTSVSQQWHISKKDKSQNECQF